jgi:hypothetical protein
MWSTWRASLAWSRQPSAFLLIESTSRRYASTASRACPNASISVVTGATARRKRSIQASVEEPDHTSVVMELRFAKLFVLIASNWPIHVVNWSRTLSS